MIKSGPKDRAGKLTIVQSPGEKIRIYDNVRMRVIG